MRKEVGKTRKPFPLSYVSRIFLRSHELMLNVVLQRHLVGIPSYMHTLVDSTRWIAQENSGTLKGMSEPRRVLCGAGIVGAKSMRDP